MFTTKSSESGEKECGEDPSLARDSILDLITSDIFLNICHSSLGFRFGQAQEKIYDYAAMSKEMGIPEYSPHENLYEDTSITRLTPDSIYEM